MAVSHYIAERFPTDYPFLCKTQGFNLEPMQDVFYWEILHQAHRGAPYLVGWPNGKETIQCISTSPSTFNPQRVVLPNEDDIEIGYRYNGRPLKTWLNSAYFARMSPGIATLANQQVWWELNGQSFRLMDLPPELRICIYEQVFATYTWKHAPDNAPAPSVLLSSGPTGPRVLVDNALVHASSQVYREMMRIAWEGTWKHFHYPYGFMAFITSGNPPVYKSLTRVSPSFSNAQFLELLGMHDDGSDGVAAIQVLFADISILGTLLELVYLNFHFSVYWRERDDAEDAPPFRNQNPWEEWSFDASGGVIGAIVSCQKVFVERFFTLALHKIRGINHISFTGDVKKSTRTRWELVFENKRRVRGSYDMTHDIILIKNTP